MKTKIQAFAREIGIDKIGFGSADPFLGMAQALQAQKDAGHTSGFEHPVIAERVDPGLILPGARSLIAIALAYPTVNHQAYPRDLDNRRGEFARASWGLDYHHILKEKLDALIQFIEAEQPGTHCKGMVDTGELVDVAVAERCGLGFIGRNGLLITEEFGSFVYLGEIVTDLVLEPDEPVPFGCGDCYRCVDACPGGALLGDGRMNAQRCLSYQTQTKGYMPAEFRRKMTNVIYGCDICQLVCPYNQGKDFHRHPQMEPNPDQVQPALKPMLAMSNREFKEQFSSLAGSWRGKKPLQRNAIIALANARDTTAIPHLIQVLEEDPRPMMRGTAAWALSQIQRYYNPLLVDCVQDQLAKEEDPETIEEMTQALEALKTKRSPRPARRE